MGMIMVVSVAGYVFVKQPNKESLKPSTGESAVTLLEGQDSTGNTAID